MTDAPLSLSIREEGEFVNAYLRLKDDPKAMFLGSMNVAIMEKHPELFQAWKHYMSVVMLTMLDYIGEELGMPNLSKDARLEERKPTDTEGSA